MDEEQKLDFLRRAAASGAKANMWRIGEELGLTRDATEYLCMDLFAQGMMEVVNLSGGVRLTTSGEQCLGPAQGASADTLAAWLKDARALGDPGLTGQAAQDLAADLKALEAQTERSQPLAPVVKACLEAAAAALVQAKAPAAVELAQRAKALSAC
jgi:hypothetical protein